MFKIKKIVSLLLFVLYAGYYTSTNFFYHTHNYAWGTITHSHPYTSGSHAHSANALLLINNLTNLLFTGVAAVFFLALLPASRAVFFSVETRHATSLRVGSNLLRAPPVLA